MVPQYTLSITGSLEDLQRILQVISQEPVPGHTLPPGSFTWQPIHEPAQLSHTSSKLMGTCADCSVPIHKNSNAQRYCDDCKSKHKKEAQQKAYEKKVSQRSPARRQFYAPGTDPNFENALSKKLERIKETCPAPTPRPDIKRDL